MADSLEQARATSNITVGSMPTRAVGSLPGSSEATSTDARVADSTSQPVALPAIGDAGGSPLTGPLRLLLQGPKDGNATSATQLNYVLAADNTTLVPLLESFASVNTSTPMLLYVTGNVTMSRGAGVPARGIAINRFLHWVGLSSRNTSVDWHMEVRFVWTPSIPMYRF